MRSSRWVWVGLALAWLVSGCSALHENSYRIVANGRIFSVSTLEGDRDRFLEVDGLRDVLVHLGAAVDVNGADNILAIAFPNGDDQPKDWPTATGAEAAYTVVFNEQVLKTPILDDEGRPYLSLRAFRSLCVAMKRRVSAPPYDALLAIAPPDGEDLPTPDAQNPTHAVQLPGKGAH